MSRRRFYALGLAAALLVAGVLSYYASSHPDGLEFVAEKTGFAHAAEDSAASGSPLADYQLAGIDDPRLSVAVAGVLGVLVVLLLTVGLTWLVRRRPPGSGRGEQ